MRKIWYKIKRFFKWLFLGDHQLTLGRIPITLKGLKWELNIYDRDCRPSVPHLHCIENHNIKINIYNGEVYEDGINTGKLKDKEFNALWHNKTFLNLVNRARDFYKKEYPNYKLVNIPYSTDEIDENVIITRGKNKDELIIEYKNAKKEK